MTPPPPENYKYKYRNKPLGRNVHAGIFTHFLTTQILIQIKTPLAMNKYIMIM